MECISITSPLDDEENEECMPKILNTISLQGCSEVSFHDGPENEDVEATLYPECEIKEENTESDGIKTEPIENGLSRCSKDKEEKNKHENKNKKEKKRLNLTQLSPVKREKTSTSRRYDHNVVDAGRLALQESLFKTKELFDTFLRVCQDQENSEQMERVVEKLGRAYSAARQDFLGSPAFQNIVEAEMEKVNTSNTKPWLNLKLVLDELKYNKKAAGSKLKLGESEESQDAGTSNDDEPIIECPKKRRHLKKLEKVLRAINLKIKKLEEREVDWDEEDNSSYCKLDRYRAQFTKIYTKICEIKGKLPDADRPYLRKVSFAGTTYPHINRCIEKYYNKHREFPDFQDIKKLVTLALKQEGIEMPPIKIHSMAAAAFKEFGEMLKRLRQYDDYDVLISYLDQQVDPARNDQELQEQLNMNALMFKKKEQEVIDRFVEKESTRDICSESGEDSDSKSTKKKRKILITNSKKSGSPVKQTLSSSESSDEEDENSKTKSSFALSCDSDNSDSASGEKVKKQSVKCKGKSLVGKQRIVKKGKKKSSPNKSQKPKTVISSDEESFRGNTKESLTNYLGLQGRSSPKVPRESKEISETEDEITCISQIKVSPEKFDDRKRNAASDNSDTDTTTKTEPVALTEIAIRSDNSQSRKRSSKDIKNKTIPDSDSDVEPIVVINRSRPSRGINTRKRNSQVRKSTGLISRKVVPTKHIVDTDKTNTHETTSNSSESESRTSEEENESDAKKSLSDVELSSGTKDLSSDSSNEEVGKKNDEDQDLDNAIVILSEDVVEEPKPAAPKQNLSKPQEDSSDSDDICILSPTETKRTVAPRKTKPNSAIMSSSSLPRKAGVATSTPTKFSKPPLKRRLSNQSNNGNNIKTRKLNGNGKQSTLSQVINGASRKILITRISKSASSSDASTPEPIPLIELD